MLPSPARKSPPLGAAAPTSPADLSLPCILKTPFWIFLLLTSLFLLLFLFSTYPSLYVPSLDVTADPPSAALPPITTPTSLSHLFFSLGSSASTWPHRLNYSLLWFLPNLTLGSVWLDRDLAPGPAVPPWPPVRVSSGDAPQFGARAAASRIATIVKDSCNAVKGSDVRWLVVGDDDTVFFPENVAAVLGRYDHREAWYVGGVSESVEQDVIHSYAMAFGGGGFAVSLPAAREVSKVLEGCLERYREMWGGDERVHACMSEIGVPLTREIGFHQVDLRGSLQGFLAAHPLAPIVSLHHLDNVDPIFPGSANQFESIGKLMSAYWVDPIRTLQQSICYEQRLNWSVSVSWGYAVHIYPHFVVPYVLEVPLQTFKTWRSWQDGPFTFNTRTMDMDKCEQPVVLFLDRVHADKIAGGSVTEYMKGKHGVIDGGEECTRSEFIAASKIQTVKVFAPKMDPDDWKRAPRRRCCDAKRSWWGSSVEVRIRKCRPGESLLPL